MTKAPSETPNRLPKTTPVENVKKEVNSNPIPLGITWRAVVTATSVLSKAIRLVFEAFDFLIRTKRNRDMDGLSNHIRFSRLVLSHVSFCEFYGFCWASAYAYAAAETFSLIKG
jgi:hypothetical protein